MPNKMTGRGTAEADRPPGARGASSRRRSTAVVAIVALDLVSALLCLYGAVRPPMPDTPVRLNLVLATIALSLAAAVWTAGPRLRSRLIPLNVVVHVLGSSVSISQAATGEGAVSGAFSYVVLAVYVAAFLRPAAARGLLGLIVVSSAVAMYVSDAIGSPLATWLPLAFAVVVTGSLFTSYVEEMRRLTVTDSLTGAVNRTGLARAVSQEQASSRRTGEPLTVVVIDLDGFKAINDEHGHAAGDALLVELVDHWHATLRPRDVVSRRGGDEFVVLMPGVTEPDAARAVERLLVGSPLPWSSGVAAVGPGDDLEHALRLADARMYERKHRGTRTSRPAPAPGAEVAEVA